MKHTVTLDYTNVLSGAVGTKHGITPKALERLAPEIAGHHKTLMRMKKAGRLGFAELPYEERTVAEVAACARRRAGRYENFVLIGIGGSSLGPVAVHAALNHPLYDLDAKFRDGAPRLFVLDNIDPDAVHAVLGYVNPKKTLFNVVTKSGSTAETMSQFLIVRRMLKKTLGKRFAENIIATTDAEKGDLRKLVERDGCESFVIPANVGGRFSVLTPVGLLPAAITGVNVSRLVAGARAMADRCATGALARNPAYLFAAVNYIAAAKKGKSICVMMPYSHALRHLADWFVQLWAESLGKRLDASGKVVNAGQTPLKAVGPTDQHSQVQLFVEGPHDKIFTFLHVKNFAKKVNFPPPPRGYSSLEYFKGKSLNELIEAEFQGTVIALRRSSRPSLTISIESLTPEALGGLFYLFELATAMSGELYGIDAFNQPGVEGGKQAAYALMGRAGYEKTGESIRKEKSRLKPKTV